MQEITLFCSVLSAVVGATAGITASALTTLFLHRSGLVSLSPASAPKSLDVEAVEDYCVFALSASYPSLLPEQALLTVGDRQLYVSKTQELLEMLGKRPFFGVELLRVGFTSSELARTWVHELTWVATSGGRLQQALQ